MPIVIPVGLVFLANSFLLGSALSRIPDLQAQLGVDKAELGLMLFAGPVGTLLSLPFAGPLVGRLTPRRGAVLAIFGQALVLPVIGLATHPLAFVIPLFLFGMLTALTEVGMNAQAELVETRTGEHIISRCHGFWSLGIMLGGLATAFSGQAGVPVEVQFLGSAVAAGALILWLYTVLPLLEPDARARATTGPFALPSRAAIGACLMVIGVTLAEGATLDWSTLYLRTELAASPFEEGFGYAIFAFTMALARFGGDAVRARFSGQAIVLASALLTFIGLLGFAVAPNVPLSFVALALMGVGVSAVYPIGIAAAASAGGASPATNVAGLTLVVSMTILFAPPVIGYVSESVGLRYALLGILPLVAITAIFSGHARVRGAADVAAPLVH